MPMPGVDDADSRVGLGYDIHRLFPGHVLVLGGVTIPAAVGFDTHSDGDVLSHAVVDAMAGGLDVRHLALLGIDANWNAF